MVGLKKIKNVIDKRQHNMAALTRGAVLGLGSRTMYAYRAPLDDYRFMLLEVLDFPAKARERFAHADIPDGGLTEAVLTESAKFCEEVLFPLNRSGDEHGASLINGSAAFPPGFREAYAVYRDSGWPGLSCSPEHGGQGLPHVLNMPLTEMICSANLAFGVTPALTRGAYTALKKFGSEELKSLYLQGLATGEWTATMCLTEAQAGTDLSLLHTHATASGNGKWRLTGSKIFISGGDHDLTENILHLVLAKLPGAPAGARGVSLFVVPKYRGTIDGSGKKEKNGVTCESIESKMGLHASPTCSLRFENAEGMLVGEPHRGLQAMFVMMNEARIYVGVQGVGLAEAARQQALAYARERIQGRAPEGARRPEQSADPLTVHPDVRRMLLTMRSYCEAGRMLALYSSFQTDMATHASRQEDRKNAEDFLAFSTPIMKAFFSDAGFDCANMGLQIFGGHGYIREYGMEQFVRDARVAQIYEGANGVQALDLAGRKLSAHGGRALRPFFWAAQAWTDKANASELEELKPFAGAMDKALKRTRKATFSIAERGYANPGEVAAVSYDYLRVCGLSLSTWMYCMMAEKALTLPLARLTLLPDDFYRAKLTSAKFFIDKILPAQEGALISILNGGGSINAPPEGDL